MSLREFICSRKFAILFPLFMLITLGLLNLLGWFYVGVCIFAHFLALFLGWLIIR